jgi:hypothetical protein
MIALSKALSRATGIDARLLLRADQDNRHVLRLGSVRIAAVCDLWARSQPRLFLTPSSGPAKARDRSPRPPFLSIDC